MFFLGTLLSAAFGGSPSLQPRNRDFRFAPRSETLQGRKKFMSANEANFQSSRLT